MTGNSFDAARMQALKDYADLEYELCLLLKAILQVEAPIASAIFYQISSARVRYAIFASVLDIRYQDTFKKPWPKLEKWLLPCDTARNHIVHWGQDIRIIVNTKPGLTGVLDPDSEVIVDHALLLTNNVRKWRGSEGPSYSEDAIRTEAFKIRVMKHIINRFNNCLFRPDDWPWTDIFQQPITDRTPEEFLSRLNDRGYPALA